MSSEDNGRRKGVFISIEGPDGAGKTTQAHMLKERLESQGYKVFLTREPGGTPIGEEIRSILLNPRFEEMSVSCEILLYSAARSQLVKEVLRPYLESGYMVITDRYLDSSLVYQGLAGGAELEMIRNINLWATAGLLPDITFLLDVDAGKGLQRLEGKGTSSSQQDRMEQKELVFHRKVQEGFLFLASQEKKRFVVIKGEDEPHEVHDQLWHQFQKFLFNKKNASQV